MLDLANYHHLYAEVLLGSGTETGGAVTLPADMNVTRFKIAPSVRMAYFTYDIEELLDCGEPQIRRMYENLSRTGSQAVIYRNGGTVCTESLDSSYIHLLERIRDGIGIESGGETGLTDNETIDFLTFALQEGILVSR